MASKVSEILVGALAPVLANVGREQLTTLFNKLHEDNPAVYKTVMVALYPIVDVQLETLTDKSKTKLDDIFVDAFKGAIEDSSEANGVELQNLDQD
jgi:hypothetical protein